MLITKVFDLRTYEIMEHYATDLTLSFGFCFYFPLWICYKIFVLREREREGEREKPPLRGSCESQDLYVEENKGHMRTADGGRRTADGRKFLLLFSNTQEKAYGAWERMVWFDSKLIKWLMPSSERHGEKFFFIFNGNIAYIYVVVI